MNLQIFETRPAASRHAAILLASVLNEVLAEMAPVSLMVSGGSTPADCLTRLSEMPLPWADVQVTLTDERCVPVTDEASNENMVRRLLLRHNASVAQFVPLSPENAALIGDSLACALVGMGEDGHFASIFPDNPLLAHLLDPEAGPACEKIKTVASPLPRLTANLSLITRAKRVVLLVFGDAKYRLVQSPEGLPVAALLEQTRVPVDVCWAP